jgi:hypothetical protein
MRLGGGHARIQAILSTSAPWSSCEKDILLWHGTWKERTSRTAPATSFAPVPLVGANVVPLISENLGMEVASIEHVDDGLRHRVKVGDAIDVEIEDLVSPFDPDGPLPKLTETKHPANSDLTPARTLSARVQGLGIDYSAEGKSGFSTPFSWSE